MRPAPPFDLLPVYTGADKGGWGDAYATRRDNEMKRTRIGAGRSESADGCGWRVVILSAA